MTAITARAGRPPRAKPSGSDLKRDGIYEQLLLDIICGTLRPGERIDEAALAELYGAGRAGVRDALFRLALEGLVERRARLGTIVTTPSLLEMEQVFQLRVQLEGQCAALAARNARERDIRAMKAALTDVDRLIAGGDWNALVRADRAFHRAVSEAAQHEWLARTLATLQNSALRFWHYALSRRPVDAVKKEMQYHREIATAIERRDPDGAQKATRAVLGEFPATVQSLFSDALGTSR